MQFNIGDEVTLINGVKAHIIDVVQDPISQNLVYVVDQPFVGEQDDVFGYNRQYYGDNTFYVYPSEIKGKTEVEMKEEINSFGIDIDSSKLIATDLIKHEINESPIKNTKLPNDIIYSEAAQEKFIDGVRAVIREMSNDEELIQNTPRRLLKAFDEWFKESNVPLEQIAKETCKTFESENTDLIIADNIEVFATCCHHCCPYSTTIAIGVVPDGRVMGLSKYSRVVKRVARRFDSGMVENLVTNIYKVLKAGLGTDNIMVVAYSKPGQVHTCAASRGANDTNMQVTSSSIHGLFVANPELKREFLSLIRK